MTDDLARDRVFWKLIETLESAGALQHVMIIGTWAEWLYTDYFSSILGKSDFRVDIGKTHDIDVFVRDYLVEIEGASRLPAALSDAGFVAGTNPKGTFFCQGIEVEFLAGTLMAGKGMAEIPSLGIVAERLEHLSMLKPAWVELRGYRICVPTPASYIAHKLFINPERRPVSKRGADIRKVSVLLRAMAHVPGQIEELRSLIGGLPESQAARIREVAIANGIELP